MKIIVTGMPRTRSTLIVNELAKVHNLDKPLNFWGETHRFGEDCKQWVSSNNSVFKCWKPFTENYIPTLEEFDGNIIVTYTNDISVFVAKVIRAEISKDWGITPRELQKISFSECLPTLTHLTPIINGFIQGTMDTMNNSIIRKKSVFVCDKSYSTFADGEFNRELLPSIRSVISNYVPPSIDQYISNDIDKFVKYVGAHMVPFSLG